MRQSTRQYKADLEELADGYQDAKDYEFNQQFKNMFIERGYLIDITEDDLQGFIDSFDFPSEEQWVVDEYQSRLDDFNDQKYQEYKERDI